MSFSQKVKEDLLKKSNEDLTADKLEMEAMLRFGGEVLISKPMKLSFTCNLMSVIRHFLKLAKQFYQIEYEIESRTISRLDNHTIYSLKITSGAEEIIKDLIKKNNPPLNTQWSKHDWQNPYSRKIYRGREGESIE